VDDSVALDIPIIRLRPLRDRHVTKREYDRILATLKAIGLIEPLIVYPDGDDYVILDGVQRYRVFLDLGIEVVPCIVGKRREAFTGNRMVNRVSPVQENRMIEQSMEELDENTIATTLGIAGISHRLKKTLLKQLHPDAAAALDGFKDYSVAFARTLILKTPPAQRDNRKRKRDPWDKTADRKNDLLKQLADAEQKHDFYSRLYKQYTVDLLRLAIFARELLSRAKVKEYLEQHHQTIVSRFQTIIADARG
jgi:ParB family chromosome partitioning protein